MISLSRSNKNIIKEYTSYINTSLYLYLNIYIIDYRKRNNKINSMLFDLTESTDRLNFYRAFHGKSINQQQYTSTHKLIFIYLIYIRVIEGRNLWCKKNLQKC